MGISIAIIIIFFILVIIIPIKIKIKYKTKLKYENEETKNLEQNEIDIENYIAIYILGFIRIIKIKINKKQDKKIIDVIFNFISDTIDYTKIATLLFSKQDLKKILNNVYIKKCNFDLSINLKNPVINAYAISAINAVINGLISRNLDKVNLNDFSYKTKISKNIFNLNLNCIIKFNLVNTINILIKSINTYRKVLNEIGKQTWGRKSNDDSNELT